jgi:hypothetical protein
MGIVMNWWIPEKTTNKIEFGYSPEYDQPYWVELNVRGRESYLRYEEVHAWVNAKFGEKTAGWNNPRWSASNRKYWFKYEKDRTLFILRWS